MKIIEPSAELFDFVDTEAVMKKLEACGRVSRLSKARDEVAHQLAAKLHEHGRTKPLAKSSADNFVRMLIKKGHESVLEHVSLTFHIICDRAIMAELTRHRHASFTVESTRYVKYNELEMINQYDFDADNFALLKQSVYELEHVYRDMILVDRKLKPEQARAVLPNCLKSELYMTANLRSWRHILKLRTDKAAHPQMRQVMNQVLAVFKEKLPIIVEDINYDS